MNFIFNKCDRAINKYYTNNKLLTKCKLHLKFKYTKLQNVNNKTLVYTMRNTKKTFKVTYPFLQKKLLQQPLFHYVFYNVGQANTTLFPSTLACIVSETSPSEINSTHPSK